MPLNVRPLDAERDWQPLAAVLEQSFNAPAEGWAVFRQRIGDRAFWVAEDGSASSGRVLGGLGVYPLGQFWSGRSVPLGGIAGVGVAPHARGRGVAKAIVAEALRAMRQGGVPVSGLFPATQTVYRSVGFEQAGERIRYEAPLQSLASVRGSADCAPLDPLAPEALAQIRARYRPAHGNLDRSAAIWARLLQPVGGKRYAWLVGNDGYLILGHSGTETGHFDLDVVDLCAPSPSAATSILALLASHRSLAATVRWWGAPADPLLYWFPEPTWKPTVLQRWMLRIADFDAALVLRGWPDAAAAGAELHLDVDDPLIPEQSGRRILRVRDGAASVEPGGEGRLRLRAAALGPLYSGYLPASTLAALGLVEGDAPSLRTANALFAGPTPWMREMY
jgi:predicted acetyltransferase